MNKIFSRGIYFFVLIVSFFFFIWHQYFSYIFYLSNTDDNIYAQALQLISWNDLNPFLTIRQVHIFNDHFDPIIIPFALILAKIFPPLAVGYFLETLFLFLSCAVLFYMYKKKDISFSVLTFATLILLFSEGTVMAMTFPFHPTTWAVFPMTLLGYFVYKENKKGIILSLIFLFLFKEWFVFCGIMLSFYYLWKRNFKLFAWVFCVSVFWYILAFHARYWLLPYESVRYDGIVTSRLTFDGIKNMFYAFFHGKKVLQHNFILFLPLLVMIIYATYKKIRFNFLWVWVAIPLWLILFLSGADFWEHHHLVGISVLIALSIVFTFGKKEIHYGVIVGLLLFLLLANAESFIRWFTINPKSVRHLTSTQKWERKKALDEAIELVKRFPNSNVFTFINLSSHLTKNKHTFFASGFYGSDKMLGYNKEAKSDFLLVEKEPNGDPYPKDFDHMNELSRKWMNEGAEKIIDNSYVLLLKKPPLSVVGESKEGNK